MESIGQRVGGKIQKTEDGGQTTIADLGLGIGHGTQGRKLEDGGAALQALRLEAMRNDAGTRCYGDAA